MKSITISLCLFFFSTLVQAQTFTLTSPDIEGQATSKQVFNGFGCTGGNISPKLQWKNAPKGTKSFAITMYDPDAPTGSGWWHWVVFDIPSDESEIVQKAGDLTLKLMPKGIIQSLTDYGTQGYGGPCPPKADGAHQYIITIHALQVETLGLDKTANPALAGYYINANTIQKASLVMYYDRD